MPDALLLCAGLLDDSNLHMHSHAEDYKSTRRTCHEGLPAADRMTGACVNTGLEYWYASNGSATLAAFSNRTCLRVSD